MSQPRPGKIYISVTRNDTFLSLPAQTLFWARSKSIEIPLNWAKLNMHQLPGTWQTPCLPYSFLIIYMHVSLVLCKILQEGKLLQQLSWDCQDSCIPTAMSMERFCWREDFGVGVRSFWRMMLPLSPGKRWWKNRTFLISWPFCASVTNNSCMRPQAVIALWHWRMLQTYSKYHALEKSCWSWRK